MMDDAIMECIQQERPITFTGTLLSESMRAAYYFRQALDGFIKALM